MNKIQQRQVAQAKTACSMGLHDMAARSLSALIRCAMRQSQRDALMQAARDLGIASHPDFII